MEKLTIYLICINNKTKKIKLNQLILPKTNKMALLKK